MADETRDIAIAVRAHATDLAKQVEKLSQDVDRDLRDVSAKFSNELSQLRSELRELRAQAEEFQRQAPVQKHFSDDTGKRLVALEKHKESVEGHLQSARGVFKVVVWVAAAVGGVVATALTVKELIGK